MAILTTCDRCGNETPRSSVKCANCGLPRKDPRHGVTGSVKRSSTDSADAIAGGLSPSVLCGNCGAENARSETICRLCDWLLDGSSTVSHIAAPGGAIETGVLVRVAVLGGPVIVTSATEFLIGRSAASLVADALKELDDVSRVHAFVEVRGNELLIRDMYSMNGTFVDGEPLVPGRPVRISPDSTIRLASKCNLRIAPGSG